jgi:uncharacterized membrane protein
MGMDQSLRDESRPVTETHHHIIQAVLHRHVGRVRNVNDLERDRLTLGQRIADTVARTMGSWHFIIVQSCLLACWVVLNVVGWMRHWDPYPFILLNLALSFQAAYAAPVIMMSQNRQSAKDRLHAEHDYQVNLRSELEVVAIQARLDELAGRQWKALLELQQQQLDTLHRIEALAREVHRATTTHEDTHGHASTAP